MIFKILDLSAFYCIFFIWKKDLYSKIELKSFFTKNFYWDNFDTFSSTKPMTYSLFID